MSDIIDFSRYPVNPLKMYGGRNGSKRCIVIDGEDYMLKLPPKAKLTPGIKYLNSSIGEHIACSVFNTLGISAQETILGIYKTKDMISVACKDFVDNDSVISDFGMLKNTIVYSSDDGYGTELANILETISDQRLVDSTFLESYFWDMFVVDALLGNSDRHNGNWGFLVNRKNSKVEMTPIYDCGNCLYPAATETTMRYALNNNEEKNRKIYEDPTSVIRIDKVRTRYADFLYSAQNEHLLDSIIRIGSKIKISTINDIVENTPIISDIHKTFLKAMIKERAGKIIEPAYLRALYMVKDKQEIKENQLLFSKESCIKAINKSRAKNGNKKTDSELIGRQKRTHDR
jgi:hypothetical protein